MKLYRCDNIWQIASLINIITNTNSTKDDWKEMAYSIKRKYNSDTIDYFGFDKVGNEYVEYDCSVYIQYNRVLRAYFVGVERC